jgi:hypothetical protein
VRLFMGVGIPERIIAVSTAVDFASVMPKVAAGFDENSVLDWGWRRQYHCFARSQGRAPNFMQSG